MVPYCSLNCSVWPRKENSRLFLALLPRPVLFALTLALFQGALSGTLFVSVDPGGMLPSCWL